jgi:non-ribosomal peptide synthase protein (TIGR01720 family)
LLEDLERLYRQQQQGEALSLPPKTTPYQYWSERLARYADAEALDRELTYWTRHELRDTRPIPVDDADAENTVDSIRAVSISLDEGRTRDLLERVHAAYNTRINDLLLCALARAYREWSRQDELLINVEGHGRESLFDDVDLARTVGWFTTIYPVLVTSSGGALGDDLLEIKERLREVPANGIGYGTLKFLGNGAIRAELACNDAEVSFTYLGQFDQTLDHRSLLRFTEHVDSGNEMNAAERRVHLLDIAGHVQNDCLTMTFYYSSRCHRESTIAIFAEGFRIALIALIEHCLSPGAGMRTPADFPLANLTGGGLESVLAEVGLFERADESGGI